jgi:hypothetical protein
MATTTKVLARAAAATSLTTLYTVPSATTTVVTNIAVTNTSASSQSYTLSLGGVVFADTVTITAKDTILIDLKQTLVATNTITGFASATSVNFHISGVEVS